MKSNADLYLNADRTKVVTAEDPAAASLLVNAGREIPDAEVEAMGAGILAQAQALAVQAVEAPAEPAEEKGVEAPSEDKAVEAPAENKSAKK